MTASAQLLLPSTQSDAQGSAPRSLGRPLCAAVAALAALVVAVGVVVRLPRGAGAVSASAGFVPGTGEVLSSSAAEPSSSLTPPPPSDSLPHIVFFLLDDAGYNDLGYNSVDMPLVSPMMDGLMRTGVRLTNYITQPSCTPTRASLLTGRYPASVGMQHECVQPGSAWGLSLGETNLLPQLLKAAGYQTAMVGKWDLGHVSEQFWPTHRGFDSWIGFTCRGLSSYELYSNSDYVDIQKGTEPFPDAVGTYSTFLFRDEALRVIQEFAGQMPSGDTGGSADPSTGTALFLYVAFNAIHDTVSVPSGFGNSSLYSTLNDGITFGNRRDAAGAMFLADQTVGDVVGALRQHGLYDTSIVVVASDNGGSPADGGNNWPLRGAKKEYFQGGVLVPAFVHSPLLPPSAVGSSFSGLMHVSDWLPTLVHGACKIALPSQLPLDGVNQWEALTQGDSGSSTSTMTHRGLRAEVLHNMDYINDDDLAATSDGVVGAMSRVIEGTLYKFILHVTDEVGSGFSWYLPYSSASYFFPDLEDVDGNEGTCFLFDLDNDPYEKNNLCFQNKYLSVRNMFTTRLCAHWGHIADAQYVPKVSGVDKRAMSAAFEANGGYITWWQDVEGSSEAPSLYPVAEFMTQIAPKTCPFSILP